MALQIFAREINEYDANWSETDLYCKNIAGFHTVQVEDFCQDIPVILIKTKTATFCFSGTKFGPSSNIKYKKSKKNT
jgi:hypothetical protein